MMVPCTKKNPKNGKGKTIQGKRKKLSGKKDEAKLLRNMKKKFRKLLGEGQGTRSREKKKFKKLPPPKEKYQKKDANIRGGCA